MPTDDEIIAGQLTEQRNNLSEKELGSQYTYLLLLRRRKVNIKHRHLIMKQKDIANAFILGHPTNGILGTGGVGLGEGTRGDYSFLRVVNPNRTYIDYLQGDLFNDTGSTTATWTGGGSISFTSGQIAQSHPIFLNNETVSTATLTAADSGGISYLLSADGGSNWESVSSGTQHVFANQGTDLRFRATSSTSSAITYMEVIY